MTQEDKELLLIDLCARLPYGVHVEISWEYSKTDIHTNLEYYEFPNIDSLLNIFWDEKCISIKPYLRPMSSMTEEEKHKLLKFGAVSYLENGEVVDVSCVGFERHADIQDYLNACHLDYRGLIDKGLALEAPEGMYK